MGKIKGRITTTGDKGTLIVKGEGTELEYEQSFSTELGIVEGASVTLEIVSVDGRKKAVCVNPIDRGEVTEIFEDGNSGTILEKESGALYTFHQPQLKALGIVVKDIVKYTLVNTKLGIMATCLTKPA